jgi:intraflagellar transport protein 46
MIASDFIPAVGDIDPFIKIPRPDGKDGAAIAVSHLPHSLRSSHPCAADVIGLTVLDEPAANQTDPTGALLPCSLEKLLLSYFMPQFSICSCAPC